MKLHEITGNQFLTDKVEIYKWIRNNCDMSGEPIFESWMTIHSDGTVDVDCDINFTNLTEFKVKFGKILGTVEFNNCKLTSLTGCPQEIIFDFICENALAESITTMKGGPFSVKGNYSISGAKGITSFKWMPDEVTILNISNTGIVSLVGIADHFERLRALTIAEYQIKYGGLGLIQIEGFTGFIGTTDGWRSTFSQWSTIINKYAGTDNIIECQSELIEAGFEEYAVL